MHLMLTLTIFCICEGFLRENPSRSETISIVKNILDVYIIYIHTYPKRTRKKQQHIVNMKPPQRPTLFRYWGMVMTTGWLRVPTWSPPPHPAWFPGRDLLRPLQPGRMGSKPLRLYSTHQKIITQKSQINTLNIHDQHISPAQIVTPEICRPTTKSLATSSLFHHWCLKL